MKKLLALLLCALLLPILPAVAEDELELPLFRLVTFNAEGREVTLGSALLAVEEDMLLTTVPVADWGTVIAYSPDGMAYSVWAEKELSHGVTLLWLNRKTGHAPAWLSLPFGVLRVVGYTRSGLFHDMESEHPMMTGYHDETAWLVDAVEPLLPGAVVTGNGNEWLGLVAATWGEGEASYVALPVSTMREVLKEAESARAPVNPGWLTGLFLRYQDGVLTVDWSGSEIEGLSEDSGFVVYVQDVGNEDLFYTYYRIEDASVRSKDIIVAPGRHYQVWVWHDRGGNSGVKNPGVRNATMFETPDSGLFTDYGFTSECRFVVTKDDGDPNISEDIADVSADNIFMLLEAGKELYLRVVNTYDVDEDIKLPLVIALETPEGYLFTDEQGYIFSPEYEENDVWSVPVGELFKTYFEYGVGYCVPGEYRLRYAIDGVWAGEYAFTKELRK